VKIRNQRIYSQDRELLQRLADEQRDYIGRDFKLDLKQGLLIIFALPARYKKKQDKQRPVRDKRSEKFERRSH